MTIRYFLAAFLTGLGIMLALEAWFRSRQRLRGRRSELFAALALICLAAATVTGRAAQQPVISRPIIAALPATAVTTTAPAAVLPQPEVLILPGNGDTDSGPAIPPQPSPPQPIRLQIPTLRVDEVVRQVPVQDGRWDVSELGGQVGLLATTGQSPHDELAMVFAGHMTFPNANLLETGAFADLQYASYGTEIILQTDAGALIYEIEEISRIPPQAVDRLYVADNTSILLITCTDWAEQDGIYANRLLVRARLVASDMGTDRLPARKILGY